MLQPTLEQLSFWERTLQSFDLGLFRDDWLAPFHISRHVLREYEIPTFNRDDSRVGKTDRRRILLFEGTGDDLINLHNFLHQNATGGGHRVRPDANGPDDDEVGDLEDARQWWQTEPKQDGKPNKCAAGVEYSSSAISYREMESYISLFVSTENRELMGRVQRAAGCGLPVRHISQRERLAARAKVLCFLLGPNK
jgi:hypothetical protein